MDDLSADFASSFMRAYCDFRSNHRLALQQAQHLLAMEASHDSYIHFEEVLAFAILKTHVVAALAHNKIARWTHLYDSLDTLRAYLES